VSQPAGHRGRSAVRDCTPDARAPDRRSARPSNPRRLNTSALRATAAAPGRRGGALGYERTLSPWLTPPARACARGVPDPQRPSDPSLHPATLVPRTALAGQGRFNPISYPVDKVRRIWSDQALGL